MYATYSTFIFIFRHLYLFTYIQHSRGRIRLLRPSGYSDIDATSHLSVSLLLSNWL